eukprot:3407317-Prymnesium_polylepis.1
MQAPARQTCFLRQTERFKEQAYRAGSADIRLGSTSTAALKLVKIASDRVLREDEDLDAMTLFGTSEEVMRRSMQVVPLRAARSGLSEQNGGVWVYRDEDALS